MSNIDQIVLFGPPGVGKSTVGRVLASCGYYYFDGDSYSLPEGIVLNQQGKTLTPELRDREYTHIFNNFITHAKVHQKIVMDYHLMFDRYRISLRQICPGLRWIYLSAPFRKVMGRLDRPGHILTNLEFIEKIFSMFEEPSFPVEQIDATLPVNKIVKQILRF